METAGKLHSGHIVGKESQWASCLDADIYMQSEAHRLLAFISVLNHLAQLKPFAELHSRVFKSLKTSLHLFLR